MAWEHFPVQSGQRLTAAMLNELRYAAQERGLPSSGLLAEPQSGWSETRAAAWLSDLRTCISGTTSTGNNFADLTWTSSSDASAPLYTMSSFLTKVFGQAAWPHPLSRGTRISADALNDIYDALNELRFRTFVWCDDVSGSGYVQACTNGAPAYPKSSTPPYYPTYAKDYLCYGATPCYTPTEAGLMAIADADTMLANIAYIPQTAAIYGSWVPIQPDVLWHACEMWNGSFSKMGDYVDWNAIRGWAVRAFQLRYVKPDLNLPPGTSPPTVISTYVPMSFFCRMNSVSGFPWTKLGPLTRTIGVDVRYADYASRSASRTWGTLCETVSVTGQLDNYQSNCITRMFKIVGLPGYVGAVVNASADGATSIRGAWNTAYQYYRNAGFFIVDGREYGKEEVSVGWSSYANGVDGVYPVVECDFVKSA
jgi:hypothetical protein